MFYMKQGVKLDFFLPFLGYHFGRKTYDELKYGKTHAHIQRKVNEHPEAKFYMTHYTDKVCLYILDPVIVEEFLREKQSLYVKYEHTFNNATRLQGTGLRFSHGDIHERRRKAINEVMSHKNWEGFITSFIERSVMPEMQEYKVKAMAAGGSTMLDPQQDMFTISGQWLAKMTFGSDLKDEKMEDGTPAHIVMAKIMEALVLQKPTSPLVWIFGDWVMKLGITPSDYRIKKQIMYLRRLVRKLYNERVPQVSE